jgi:alkylhydroperoxidase/carboxymuconolactone decarboxylase family protein YurZ
VIRVGFFNPSAQGHGRDRALQNQKITLKELSPSLRAFIRKYPQVWTAHERLGVECARAGPLTSKEIQLIKIAVTGSLMLETSFKTHVQKAIRAKARRTEVEHTIIQMLPIVGIGRTMTAMKWYSEALHKSPK